jgi:hypothetical protein
MSYHYTENFADDDFYDDNYADDYADSYEKSYYGAAKLPSGAGKQMYTDRATRIQVSSIEKRFKQGQKPPKTAKAGKNFKK